MTPPDGVKNEMGGTEAQERILTADLRSVHRLLEDIIQANRALGSELSGAALSKIVLHMYECDMCFIVYACNRRVF